MNALASAPEYRALMLFDRLPAGCIAVRCDDHFSMPHIRPGEYVVVDTTDRKPRHLETYVIEWNGGRRNICEAIAREFNWCDATIPRAGWLVCSIRGPRGRAAVNDWLDQAAANSAAAGGIQEFPAWSEGPFRSDDGYLESKLVGCVIGLYQPRGGAS